MKESNILNISISARTSPGRVLALVVAFVATLALAMALASPNSASAAIAPNTALMDSQASALSSYANTIQSGTAANRKAAVSRANGTLEALRQSVGSRSSLAVLSATQVFQEKIRSGKYAAAATTLRSVASKVHVLAKAYRNGDSKASLA